MSCEPILFFRQANLMDGWKESDLFSERTPSLERLQEEEMMNRACRSGVACLIFATAVGACSERPPAIVEATDRVVVIRDVPSADKDVMLEKAGQVCGVHGKAAVYAGNSCGSMMCDTQLFSYECR